MTISNFEKVLVANRGEIAIRIFRACTELGIRTLGVYSKEDRFALHRYKADETYQLDDLEGPIRAYLDISGIISIAKRHGADAIHPGYGFLSENADFAQACENAGIAFIGPTPHILRMMGDKTAARRQAQILNIPVVPGTDEPLANNEAALSIAKKIGYPVILKASFGGGGRGMRVCYSSEELIDSLQQAANEAASAFGRSEIFLEKFLESPKHVEVQVLGDKHGNIVHLYERDCSVQRRHQKVVEIAPSPSISEELREKLCSSAVRLASSVKYLNAGTIEFLLDKYGNYYFIEMNPRVQVEHTVTEMVTGIDIVKSQIRIAEGYEISSKEIGIKNQSSISMRGYAIQCRITTEDPTNNFIPDYGRITHYRSPAGFGIRLDAGTAATGAVVTPYYDSLLVKATSWALTYEEACSRMDRALAEWRVRGVRTNIPFLQNVVRHPVFITGNATTTFIQDHPELLIFPESFDRATKLLSFIGDISVNGNSEVKGIRPKDLRHPVIPQYDSDSIAPYGTRTLWKEIGTEKFMQWIKDQKRLLITDTTLRDAHQSLLATRMRTYDMLKIAPAISRLLPGLFSLEMWGGATFDVAMRFLHEDPWERLEMLRRDIPNILFQMLFRGSNAVGYANYPDNVVRAFIEQAVKSGIDIFRIFDSLNWLPGIIPALEMVRETGGIAEAAICYTGDLFDPKRSKYNIKYYVNMAKQLEKAGANILAIKDMAGLLRPYAARKLIASLKEEIGIPIHFHTHDTAGIQEASILFASESGVDIADVCFGAMSGLTSQPNLESLVAALQRQERDTELDFNTLLPFTYYWEDVRTSYASFESGLKSSSADVYIHEIPGGQYSNLRPQAESMGLGDRITEIKRMYAVVNEMLGDIVKVTPSSKIVGDLALFMITNNLTPETLLERGTELTFPESIIGFFAGEIGYPDGGFPEKLRQIVLRDRKPYEGRPGDTMTAVDLRKTAEELQQKTGRVPDNKALLSYLMYPKVYPTYAEHLKTYSDVTMVPTNIFFYGLEKGEETEIEIEKGKTLFIKLVTVSDPDEEGYRTLFFELNGHSRETKIQDKSLAIEVKRRRKADVDNLHHLAAPMPGLVVDVLVKAGQTVKEQDKLLVIQAMKMETSVHSPMSGVIREIYVSAKDSVESGDLLIVFQ